MQKLKNKKIFVTGGGGFIGSHLVDKLVRKGIDVRVFVRYNSRNDWGMIDSLPLKIKKAVDVYQGDLKDPWSVKKAVEGCNVVFHLGALIAIPYSYMNPIDFVQTNVLSTAYLLRACLDTGIERFIHTSTSEVYGTAQYVPIDEAHPLTAQSPYSATKIAADKLVESFYRTYKLPTVTVRPFNTYGPGQSARAIVPTIITQALTRKTIKLGSLTHTRDLTSRMTLLPAIAVVNNTKNSIMKLSVLNAIALTTFKYIMTMILVLTAINNLMINLKRS